MFKSIYTQSINWLRNATHPLTEGPNCSSIIFSTKVQIKSTRRNGSCHQRTCYSQCLCWRYVPECKCSGMVLTASYKGFLNLERRSSTMMRQSSTSTMFPWKAAYWLKLLNYPSTHTFAIVWTRRRRQAKGPQMGSHLDNLFMAGASPLYFGQRMTDWKPEINSLNLFLCVSSFRHIYRARLTIWLT